MAANEAAANETLEVARDFLNEKSRKVCYFV